MEKAVAIFWSDIKCGPLPSTLVFDGITFGLPWRKVQKFQEKMKLLLGRKSKKKLSTMKYQDRVFIKKKTNRLVLKEAANNKIWPQKDSKTADDNDEYTPGAKKSQNDDGMMDLLISNRLSESIFDFEKWSN